MHAGSADGERQGHGSAAQALAASPCYQFYFYTKATVKFPANNSSSADAERAACENSIGEMLVLWVNCNCLCKSQPALLFP